MRTRTIAEFLLFSVLVIPGGLWAQTPAASHASQSNIPVRVRDGAALVADVYLPEKDGKYPVILIRTPYGKDGYQGEASFFVRHGYVVVVQDTRGRGKSGGEWYAFAHEADDGYDTIEWAAKQPWSNGKVVTMGGSYLAIDQWLAATRGNPHLAAMVTLVSPSDLYANAIHNGGALQYGTALTWSIGTSRRMQSGQTAPINWPELFRFLPVRSATAEGGDEVKFYGDWTDHSARDAYWQALSWREAYTKLAVPVMHIGGWFDIFQEGTIENFLKMTARSPGVARSAQRLIVGPWAHGAFGSKVGQVDFGPQSRIDLRAKELRWLGHYVSGEQNGADSDAPVEIFVMGVNEWTKEKAWPPAGTKPTKYFLHSQGNANTSGGDGTLSLATPKKEPVDHFDYDPANPVPTNGGGTCCSPAIMPWGPLDQRDVEKRQDVLVYSTAPLEQDFEVTGPVEVHLFASTSGRDADWTAKLVDVAPGGPAINLTDGILRARFRKSLERPDLLEHGKVYEFSVSAGNTGNVFLKGHRVRLEVSSSNFPRFTRNTNTGNVPEKDSSFVVAHQTIYHDKAHASYVLLPVRPRH